MSYSVIAVGKTKKDVVTGLIEKLGAVVEAQPVHKHDIEQAKTAAFVFLGIVQEPEEGFEIVASVSGSLSWKHEPGVDPDKFVGANFSVAVSTRQTAEQGA